MSLQSSFYGFMTGTDYATNSNGGSSVVFYCDSNFGSLLKSMDSDHNYHLTGLGIQAGTTAKYVDVAFVTFDSDGITAGSIVSSDVVETIQSRFYRHDWTDGQTPSEINLSFNPPIEIKFSSNANYLSLAVRAEDSDAIAGMSYHGFTTRN